MSKYVDQIIDSINNNPSNWSPNNELNGVKSGNIEVRGIGNTKVLSIVTVIINGSSSPTTYFDKWKLEVAVLNWFRTVDVALIVST